MPETGRLLIACPDQPGVVAVVSDFLFRNGANIVHSDQHSTDLRDGTFFMRIEFDLPGLGEGRELAEKFEPIATRLSMAFRVVPDSATKRLAVFVSLEDHCLQELLWNVRAGDIRAEIAMVVSNHPNLEEVVRPFGIAFHHVPVEAGHKREAEIRQLELVRGKADAIVLARYMQILSAEFLAHWHDRVINIHHSFLPAFAGANPYRQAHQRGVKLIGATAHYVTAELDAGPIIEQDVERVDHRCDVAELRRRGRHIERAVLARAVKWHVEDRVLVHGDRTIVFS